MADYQKMYYTLFHAAEAAIRLPEQKGAAAVNREQVLKLLCAAQQTCEEIYIDTEQ